MTDIQPYDTTADRRARGSGLPYVQANKKAEL